MPVKLKFLGGAREVGRSSILVSNSKKSLLLDHGVVLDHEPGFPVHVRPKDVDAVILAHAHLDHSGAVPIFYVSRYMPTFATPVTFDLVEILIRDFIRLSGYFLPYEYLDLETMINYGVKIPYASDQSVGDVSFRLLDAGHIPGSAQVLLKMDDKKILYTGDFNTMPTRLLHPADQNYGELDAIIIESTYADEPHSKREETERDFIGEIRRIVESGGKVVIPAFSVGRAQEILCILQAYRIEWPMAVDGMARTVNDILLRHTPYLRDESLLHALKSIRVVRGRRDREKVVKTAKIIVSPAGMLKGGPALYYVKQLAMDPRNAIFIVSYQIPGTPGSILLDTGKIIIDGEDKRVKAQVMKFDFSSHSGMTQLHDTLRKVEGNPKVFVTHGAQGNCEKLAKWANEELGLDAVAPKVDETYEL